MAEENGQKQSKRKKTPTRRAGIPPGPTYPDGMPQGRDVPVDPRWAAQWGYDPESARVNQVMHNVHQRKAAGDTNIRFDAPEHIRYMEALRDNPNASVRFQQIEPVIDDNIPHARVSQLDTWEKLVSHLATRHWNGKKARYKAYVYDSHNYQRAVVEVNFNERSEEDMSNQNPNGFGYPGFPGYPQAPGYPPQAAPGYPPQQVPPGYPFAPPNPWMPQAPMPQAAPPIMPVPWPMPMPVQQAAPQQAPAPSQAQPQPQPVAQPQPMPPYPMPAMMDPSVISMLMQMTRENAALVEELRRATQQPQQAQQSQQPYIPPHLWPYLMAMYQQPFYQQQPQQQQQHAQQPAPAPEPVDPMKQTFAAIDQMIHVNRRVKALQNELAPPEKDEPEPPPPPPPDDGYPYAVRDYPHMRIVASKNGEPVDAMTVLMHNGDKVAEGLKGMFKEIREGVKDVFDKREEAMDRELQRKQKQADLEQAQLERQEVSLQQGERLSKLANTMQNLGAGYVPPVPPVSPNGGG